MNRTLLEQPFDSSLIKTRGSSTDRPITYVEGTEYIRRLNEAFDGRWTFEIVKHQVRGREVLVLGRLTADGVTKMAFGGAATTEPSTLADDLKAAATDALAKACNLFGIGLHLHQDGNGGDSTAETSLDAAITKRQFVAILSMARRLGLERAEIEKRAFDRFGAPLGQLTRREASAMITALVEEFNHAAAAEAPAQEQLSG